MEKSVDAFRTISEVAADLALPQHVLRFWETRFPQIRPLKRAGGRRYYRPSDVGLLRSIRHLLYDEGYTIKGVQRLLKEGGARGLLSADSGSDAARDRLDDDDRPLLDVDLHEGGAPVASAQFDDNGDDASPIRLADQPAPDRASLREALACIEECERILCAVMTGS